MARMFPYEGKCATVTRTNTSISIVTTYPQGSNADRTTRSRRIVVLEVSTRASRLRAVLALPNTMKSLMQILVTVLNGRKARETPSWCALALCGFTSAEQAPYVALRNVSFDVTINSVSKNTVHPVADVVGKNNR